MPPQAPSPRPAPPGKLAAPECPPGWRTGPPDFVGVGAMRSGSTWWWELITAHPGVAVVPGTRKELHFFEEYWHRDFGPPDAAAYHRFFPRPAGGLVGEWTPRYMYDVWTPRMLSQAAPAARLLAILRDPLDRYRSHLGVHLQRVGAPTAAGAVASADALARSLYEPQLRRVLQRFDRDQLLVLQLERCQADPAGQLRRTYEFLGLDADFLPADHERPVNVGQVQFTPPADIQAEVVEVFAEHLPGLLRIVPDLDLDLWPSAGAGAAR
jgi:hypothetical protein